MAVQNLPIVKLDLSNGGRGAITVDGVELREITGVSVRAESRQAIRVTLDVFGDFAMPAQQAEVLMRVTGLNEARSDPAALSGTMSARGVRGAIAVLDWLASTDRPKPLVDFVKDALKPA